MSNYFQKYYGTPYHPSYPPPVHLPPAPPTQSPSPSPSPSPTPSSAHSQSHRHNEKSLSPHTASSYTPITTNTQYPPSPTTPQGVTAHLLQYPPPATPKERPTTPDYPVSEHSRPSSLYSLSAYYTDQLGETPLPLPLTSTSKNTTTPPPNKSGSGNMIKSKGSRSGKVPFQSPSRIGGKEHRFSGTTSHTHGSQTSMANDDVLEGPGGSVTGGMNWFGSVSAGGRGTPPSKGRKKLTSFGSSLSQSHIEPVGASLKGDEDTPPPVPPKPSSLNLEDPSSKYQESSTTPKSSKTIKSTETSVSGSGEVSSAGTEILLPKDEGPTGIVTAVKGRRASASSHRFLSPLLQSPVGSTFVSRQEMVEGGASQVAHPSLERSQTFGNNSPRPQFVSDTTIPHAPSLSSGVSSEPYLTNHSSKGGTSISPRNLSTGHVPKMDTNQNILETSVPSSKRRRDSSDLALALALLPWAEPPPRISSPTSQPSLHRDLKLPTPLTPTRSRIATTTGGLSPGRRSDRSINPSEVEMERNKTYSFLQSDPLPTIVSPSKRSSKSSIVSLTPSTHALGNRRPSITNFDEGRLSPYSPGLGGAVATQSVGWDTERGRDKPLPSIGGTPTSAISGMADMGDDHPVPHSPSLSNPAFSYTPPHHNKENAENEGGSIATPASGRSVQSGSGRNQQWDSDSPRYSQASLASVAATKNRSLRSSLSSARGRMGSATDSGGSLRSGSSSGKLGGSRKDVGVGGGTKGTPKGKGEGKRGSGSTLGHRRIVGGRKWVVGEPSGSRARSGTAASESIKSTGGDGGDKGEEEEVKERREEMMELDALVGRAVVLERLLRAGKRVSSSTVKHTAAQPSASTSAPTGYTHTLAPAHQRVSLTSLHRRLTTSTKRSSHPRPSLSISLSTSISRPSSASQSGAEAGAGAGARTSRNSNSTKRTAHLSNPPSSHRSITTLKQRLSKRLRRSSTREDLFTELDSEDDDPSMFPESEIGHGQTRGIGILVFPEVMDHKDGLGGRGGVNVVDKDGILNKKRGKDKNLGNEKRSSLTWDPEKVRPLQSCIPTSPTSPIPYPYSKEVHRASSAPNPTDDQGERGGYTQSPHLGHRSPSDRRRFSLRELKEGRWVWDAGTKRRWTVILIMVGVVGMVVLTGLLVGLLVSRTSGEQVGCVSMVGC